MKNQAVDFIETKLLNNYTKIDVKCKGKSASNLTVDIKPIYYTPDPVRIYKPSRLRRFRAWTRKHRSTITCLTTCVVIFLLALNVVEIVQFLNSLHL